MHLLFHRLFSFCAEKKINNFINYGILHYAENAILNTIKYDVDW